MRIYTKQEIEQVANEFNFIKNNVEKVLRLTELLEFLNENEFCKGAFALKGGTAINLCILNMPRLSVDIDLDFTYNTTKEEMQKFRIKFKEIFKSFVEDNGYTIEDSSKNGSYALPGMVL